MSFSATLKAKIRGWAKSEGFAQVGFSRADMGRLAQERYRRFIELSRHGEMSWLAADPDRRADPVGLWPEARTAIVFAMAYDSKTDPIASLAHKNRGAIALYAQGRDYHDVIKGALKRIAQKLAIATDASLKVLVDTAPILEKPLAQQAGIGWQGKHTNLVSRKLGSWFFLGEILTDFDMPPDANGIDHCGNCRRCLQICPTQAFSAPYQLDARRCISYLTIEYKGVIPRPLRGKFGNRIYGCDDCLAVCPWNKFAQMAGDARLAAKRHLHLMPLADLARLDDGAFRRLFSTTAIKRIGRDRFVRNVLIAIGNSADAGFVEVAEQRLSDSSVAVRAMAVWALSKIADRPTCVALRRQYLPLESNADVIKEWGHCAT